ncbi:MAG: hypothetical protein ACWA5L_08880 [bacterium]
MIKPTSRYIVAMAFSGILTLAACETVTEKPAPVASPPPIQQVPPTPPVTPVAPPVNLQISDFIGKPIGDLEALTGPASLSRMEGGNSFRRYDLEECRLLAIVTQDSGGRSQISALTTAAKTAGQPAPSLATCLQTLG